MLRTFKSFRFALAGLTHALRYGRSFQIQLVFGVATVALIFILDLTKLEAAIILSLIFLILSLELINTTAERIIDCFRPEISLHAKVIKDLMAAAVLVASLGAVVVGCLIFLPKMVC